MKTDKQLLDMALKIFPYDDTVGNVEDDIDAAKRQIWIMGYKAGHTDADNLGEYPDTEADGIEFCGKCGQKKEA